MTRMAEPEWDQESRDLAMALDEWDKCPACGGPAELCQDPSLQDAWRAAPPVRCHKQTALLAAQERVTEETNPQPNALLWQVVLDEERAGRR